MHRKSFLTTVLAAPLLALVAASVLTKETLDRSDGYKPTGHLAVGDVGSWDVKRVTVDGVEVKNAVELDDVEGWVRYYGPNPEVDHNSVDSMRTYHASGKVRVYYS